MSDLDNPPERKDELPADIAARIEIERRRIASRLNGRPRRVLLVGGSGYIGCPVTSHLLAQGYEIVNLDRLVYDNGSAALGYFPHPAYRFVKGDMGDPAALNDALEGVSDVILLAGLVGDPITKKFTEASAAINDAALKRCIDGLGGRGLERVIFVSTCSNYGLIPEDRRADENFELSPLSHYARSKVAAELYLLSKRAEVDYTATILRFATAFGLAPRMRFDLTVNEFARELWLDNELLVFDAHTWRPYCHVKDFARLIDRVLGFPAEEVAFEVFNAGGDLNNHTKQSIVDQILQRLPDRRVAYKADSTDPRNYRVDFSKVRTRLAFEPRYSVGDGIDEILWALGLGLFSDRDERRNFYGNYDLPGL
ncbi:MAG: NAD(P)-dependent oxidoreductase [Alphaproteobacteria bacterium]|nr:NAD(P)-dependent oxidoreductase [Alphaproteobacteria bacterium]